MKKIYELLAQKPKKGDVGIEIECEGTHLPMQVAKHWKIENDPSLRGGFPNNCCEYVLSEPILIKDVKTAVKEILDAAEKEGSKFNFSFRTSVHVHVNVQQLTEEELHAMIYTYLLLEEPLMSYCGKERKANRFCLRIRDAENTLMYVNSLIAKGVNTNVLRDDGMLRYSSINLGSLQKYGSIEFRGMRGTIDIGVIDNWTRALFALKEYAVGKTVKDVFTFYVNNSPKKFMKEVMPDVYKNFEFPKYEQEIAKSFSLSLDVAYASFKLKEMKEAKENARVKLKIDDRIWEPIEVPEDQRLWERVMNDFPVLPPLVNPAAIPRAPRRGAQIRPLNDIIIMDDLA